MKLRENDKVIYQGDICKVVGQGHAKYLVTPDEQYISFDDIDIEKECVLYSKYYPKMSYWGAKASVKEMVLDKNRIVYLELVGQEDQVRSISSVIMQGRMQMNGHRLDYSKGHFQVHKNGTKRMIQQLEDGIAHAILYHTSLLDGNVLIGNSDESLLESFKQWLQKNPIPCPEQIKERLFVYLMVHELNSFGELKAACVQDTTTKDEYEELRRIILKIAKEEGIIANNYIPSKEALLPKSPILTKKQVFHIYQTLANMPKTYETEDMEIKPIGLKLFLPSMTYYVVEADAGSPDDEREGIQTQAFGYVVNEELEEGEWGYINVDELIELGAEMDLYFENMYIKLDGQIGTLEELSSKAT